MRLVLKRLVTGLVLVMAGCQQPEVKDVRAVPATTAATVPAARLHHFEKWEKDVAAFEAADKISMPAKGAVLFVGSSTIVRWKTLQQDYPDAVIINRGFGGNEIEDSTHFADRMIFPYEPRMIFLRAGGNDVWNGKTPERVAADFKEFVEVMRGRMPGVPIAYISISPSVARWKGVEKEKAANALIEGYMKEKAGLTYIETYDLPLGANGKPRAELFVADGLHFNEAGYKLLIERVRPYVK